MSGFLDTILRRQPPPSAEEQARAKSAALRNAQEGSEEISKRLPSMLMPRKAVEMKRGQLRQLDEQTRE